MTFLEAMQTAFHDELEKISGSMQGHTRIGRKPIGVEKMLEKESELPKASEITKMSGGKNPFPVKETALLAGGALTLHQAQKMKRRYALGRQMELQNQSY